ncbi:MAG: hypothetical protein RI562_09270 [Salibacter sp.]|uniref:hypothetical protein n=1 Tax=Salibacter sp. TaxID=2010995 RepID=UPI00286FCBB8|nr:hypothetical protein [Salibacter sp.]MDR9399241.1 hypothetical protein [Salibacter sp.]
MSTAVMSQLYTDGYQSITGDNIGINKSSPVGQLHIKETPGGLDFNNNYVFSKLIRLESTPQSGGSPVYWDFRTDEGSGLYYYHSSNTLSSKLTAKFHRNITEFETSFKIKENILLDEATAPNNTQGLVFSLGLNRLPSSNTWMNKGAAFFTNSDGELQLVTNSSGNIITTTSALNDQVRLKANDSKLSLYYNALDLTIPGVLSGNSRDTDINFIDNNLSSSDKRLFVIRSIGVDHSNSPKTLEFWAPNGGNAFFTMPVRIGGNYADDEIINSDYRLYVSNGIRTERVTVDYYGTWPDYVFTPSYDLKSFDELRSFIEEKGHLPGIPTANEVKEEGIDLAKTNKALLEKVEELTLYTLELEKRLSELENNQ